MTKDEYLALITSEHSDKPKFEATVAATVAPLAHLQEVLASLIKEFDIDSAVGTQLDVIGRWVGRSRRIETPLTGVYLSWDDTLDTGWDSGIWKDVYDPDSGLVDLPDDAYRMLLRAKTVANRWDSSIPMAYKMWETAFGEGSILVIVDHQDMSISMAISNQDFPLSIVEKALIINKYLPLKPEGVRIRQVDVAPDAGPLFGFDIEPNAGISGWDAGQWTQPLITN